MNAKKKAALSDDSFIKKVINSPRFLFYSILVHVIFGTMVVMSLDWETKVKPAPHVIQATLVDESRVKAEMEKLRLADEKKKQLANAEKKKRDDAKKARQREEKRLADLKKKREAERRQLKNEEKQRKQEEQKHKKAEQERKAEEKKHRDVEKKRIADEKKARVQKQAQLDKLKAEQIALEEKMVREEEQRIQAAEALKKQQALERIRAEEARIRQQQLAEEQRLLDAAREREYQSIVDKHVEIIRQKVTRNWLRPTGSMAGLACTVQVRIIPGGDVLDVRITKSSGNAVFDRSVEMAVLKASPLPLPADRALFDRFRVLEFIFDPEG
ncbi:MAG: cell envelope integrity protein TolA [Gammaproteobacteria bacterium]|nr:cell envelope integrity protein TolA [Gammaproteobacteria bacterium]